MSITLPHARISFNNQSSSVGTMATDEEVKWHPPLKAPAVEIIDLLSDEESVSKGAEVNARTQDRDASGEESGSESDEDSQFSFWEEALNAEEEAGKFYESKRPESFTIDACDS